MKHPFKLAAVAGLLVGAIQAQAQSVIYTFSDNTSDGWVDSGFGSSPASSVSSITGNNYIFVPLNAGAFQVANVSSGDPSSALYQAMQAASVDPAGYNLSYNYYIDTSTFGGSPGTFLQLGTFVNAGNSQYFQDFPATPEVQLSGAQLASGDVFSGTVTINMGAAGFGLNPTNTFYRLGLIENGNGGSLVGVNFTDISISPVPEPSGLWLLGLAAPAWWIMRRRHSTRRQAV